MIETNETMPLSVAMRTGARLTKPLREQFVSRDGEAACALGGALIAAGHQFFTAAFGWHEALETWPLLDEVVSEEDAPCRCSLCAMTMLPGRNCTVGNWVVHLNDDALHQWPRERIAAWVRWLERK